MTEPTQQAYAEELKKLQTDLEKYRRDYAEYSNDKSVPLKETAPILASFAKLISSTLERINILEERLSVPSALEQKLREHTQQAAKKTVDERAKLTTKERELEKKSVETKKIPEQPHLLRNLKSPMCQLSLVE
jgi:hypothetical protein